MMILPFTSVCGITGLCLLQRAELRASLVRSYLILFLLIASSTELLSQFNAITDSAIGFLWIAVTALTLTGVVLLTVRHDSKPLLIAQWQTLTDGGRHTRPFLLMIAGVLSITLALALAYPPNNWDSMTYHMARVAEWIQHGNIDFYPTAIDRQNYQPPLAEFAILHLQILSTSDRFANLIQWYSFCLVIILTTLIANEFQLSLEAQALSGVIAATLPMAILQSTGTQNDLFITAFCLSFTYYLLRFVRIQTLSDAIFCTMGLGLALLTKGTAYLYCCALGLTIGGAAIVSADPSKRSSLFRNLALIALTALVLNAGHLSRNFALYGHPLSTAGDYKNEEISMTVVLSNILRNGALHLETPFHKMDSYSFRVVGRLLGDHLNNPKTTMSSTTETREPFHEDYAGNVVHFMLIAGTLLALPFVRIVNRRTIYSYTGALLFAALLYCSILKWQPWASRLQTPLFMLSAPLIAALCERLCSCYRQVVVGLALMLFASSIPFLILNKTRPFAPLTEGAMISQDDRVRSYFINHGEIYADYQAAAKIILASGAEEVGLCLQYDDYEYPLWVLAGRSARRGTPRFRHIGVVDLSAATETPNRPLPGLVVSTKRYDGGSLHGKNLIRGREREVLDPCLPGEHTLLFDSVTLRIWKPLTP